MSEKFDVIIIGGGPAGLSAGYFLSKYGFEILVIERGAKLGSKNVFGGRIYSYPLDKYFEGWRDEAPIQRWVRSERLIALCRDAGVSVEYRRINRGEYDSFTVFLSDFLEWMGELVESNGGLVATGVKVDKVLIEDGFVNGVEASGDRFTSDYVIFAEGVNSILLERLGVKRKPSTEGYAVGVKEVFRVDGDVINRFFGLGDDEGVAAYVMGGPLTGLRGGGFLYTMKDYISIGAVIHLREPQTKDILVKEIVEDIRLHSFYKALFEEATLVEYSARLVGEAGYINLLDRPYGDGYLVVGDSAGFVLNTGFTVRGVDYAILSGKHAADAIKNSHEAGSRSSEYLKIYYQYLKNGPIYKGLWKYRDIYKVLGDELIYKLLPNLLCNTLDKVYTLEEEPYKLYDTLKHSMREEGYLPILLIKLWNLVRHI